MELIIKACPLLLLVASTLAQFDGYHGYEGHHYEGHNLEGYELKHPIKHEAFEEHQGDFDTDFHAHPKYAYDYSVKDPHTGDNKEHWETRDGDKVKGSYTIIENDGTKRVVEYEADDKNGFNAVVHKIGAPKQDYNHIEEDYKKPYAREPLRFHPEYNSYEDGGFVPIVGGYKH